MKTALMRWLLGVKGHREIVVVTYDFFGDFVLLIEALGETPAWLRGDNVKDRISDEARADFWRRSGLLQHHALYDARALRHAFQARRSPQPLTTVLQKFAAFDRSMMNQGRGEQEQERRDL